MNNLITEVDILDESKDCFLIYSEEVLTDRAIPSIEDGLLSVHRKLLWTQSELLKLTNKTKYKKSASIVGSTLASSYFHGDAACYGAMCKMAQPYLMRYPLIDGDGNFGSQEANGTEASSRYTNARPSKYADLMFNDYKKNVVPTKATYNEEYMEPVYLPSLLPNAIVNGKEAIGIAMSHNSLPHNLTEVCNGIIEYIKNEDITLNEMMNYIKGPDFPLPNIVINSKDIKAAFKTGKSQVSLKVRGIYEINGQTITFTSIPYRTYRNKIKEQIRKNIDELSKYLDDFNDMSNLGENKLVFQVKRGQNPEAVIAKLFALTDLQTTVSYNMNFIVNGTPKLCSLLDLIGAYTNHQHNVLVNAATFDKDKAEARLHILQGLILAVDKIDEVIKMIKASENKTDASNKLQAFLSIDEIQANAILDMKLARLTKMNKQELVDEIEEKKKIIAECIKIIEDKSHRNEILIKKITEMRDKYGDDRRTKLLDIKIAATKEEKEIEAVMPEDVVVVLTKSGLVKRIPKKSFRAQNRNTKGVKNKDDEILTSFSTNTIDNLLLFSTRGQMYKVLVNNIPEGTNASRGVLVNSLIPKMGLDEKIAAATFMNRTDNKKFVVFITKQGMIKKTAISEYAGVKKSGIVATKIKDGDELLDVKFMDEEELILVSKAGKGIRFTTKDIHPVGRAAAGVASMKLSAGDEIVSAIPASQNFITVVDVKGCGKKFKIADLPLQGRRGVGVQVCKNQVADASGLNENDLVLIYGTPNNLCIEAKSIPTMNRIAIGNILIKDSKVNSISVIKR